MMKPLALCALLGFACLHVSLAGAQSDSAGRPAPKLLGVCTRDSLEKEPYATWFDKNYEEYEPNPDVVASLRKIPMRQIKITIFFGSWCGDSKREVPRFLKLLDAISFPSDNFTLIAVTNEDSSMKQSPTGEERDLDIYRVPTFIVSQKDKETNRIVEYPVLSLERDLLQILTGTAYQPNYRSFPVISRWLAEGLLSDKNVSHWGLANQIRGLVSSEGELSACGYVLLGRRQYREAVRLFEMNCDLYPESANRRLALARGLHRAGDDAGARRALERALKLNEDPDQLKPILDLVGQLEPVATEE